MERRKYKGTDPAPWAGKSKRGDTYAHRKRVAKLLHLDPPAKPKLKKTKEKKYGEPFSVCLGNFQNAMEDVQKANSTAQFVHAVRRPRKPRAVIIGGTTSVFSGKYKAGTLFPRQQQSKKRKNQKILQKWQKRWEQRQTGMRTAAEQTHNVEEG